MKETLTGLGIEGSNPGGFCGEWMGSGPELAVTTPIDGSQLATVQQVTEGEYDAIVSRAQDGFLNWRTVPAPGRGELVRQIGDWLREVKAELGALVTLEMGKIRAGGEGEVQEMIDICDFATGLSLQRFFSVPWEPRDSDARVRAESSFMNPFGKSSWCDSRVPVKVLGSEIPWTPER